MNYHDVAISLGWVAVGLTVWGSLAQYLRVRAHGIEGVSLATWTLFSLMGCFWISYGIDQRSAVIILGSLLVLPLQVGVVARLSPWREPAVLARVALFAFVASVMPTLLWGWSGGIYGAGVVMVITRGPRRHRRRGVDVDARCGGAGVLGAVLPERAPLGAVRLDGVRGAREFGHCAPRAVAPPSVSRTARRSHRRRASLIRHQSPSRFAVTMTR